MMMTANQLADALGRKTMAESLGVLPTAVSNAVVRGGFPPSWFMACKRLADAAGEECTIALFNMREAPQASAGQGQ